MTPKSDISTTRFTTAIRDHLLMFLNHFLARSESITISTFIPSKNNFVYKSLLKNYQDEAGIGYFQTKTLTLEQQLN